MECSSDKTTWKKLNIEEALGYAWIRLNSELTTKFIVVDIDPKGYKKHKIDKMLKKLPPNYIIRSDFKEKSLQIGYVLCDYVWHNNQYKKEQLNQVRELLNHCYNGDIFFNNHKAKNPLCCFWNVQVFEEVEAYPLDHLLTELQNITKTQHSRKNEISKRRGKNHNYKFDINSSNCQNFEDLRLKAYEYTKLFKEVSKTKEEFFSLMSNFLWQQSNPDIYKHQTIKEREATIKSICEFCYSKYNIDKDHLYTRVNAQKRKKMMECVEYLKSHYDKLDRIFTKNERVELSKKFQISEKTLKNYLSIARKEKEQTFIKTDIQQLLYYREGKKLKWKEIATLLNKTESSVKMLYKRHKEKTQLQAL
ncbi:replication initiation protein [Pasteurella multocida]